MRSRVREIRRALASRGFTHLGREADSGWLRFEGGFVIGTAEIGVEVCVDPRGIAVPKVRLKAVPPNLVGVLTPHLARGDLCYLAGDGVVLDVFDSAGQVLTCLDRARAILEQLVQGALVGDVADEFFAYWRDDSADSALYVADIASPQNRPCETVNFARVGARGFFALTDDPDRTARKLRSAGFIRKGTMIKTVCIGTRVAPRPISGPWPPASVGALLHWQDQLDAGCGHGIRKALKKAQKRNQQYLLCLIRSPRLAYGFRVDFKRPPRFRPGMRRKRVDRRRLLVASCVTPFTVTQIDDHYITTRSTPRLATLAGRKIVLLGCGTVGGYLAELLLKAGAGTDRGELRLIDKDVLLPGNIGRHRLGFNSAFQSKAEALAEELTRAAPTANIVPLVEDAATTKLSGVDLLIDATGDEALGHWLASAGGGSFIPTLSVWVEGPGVAVRALLRDTESAACLRCLNSADSDRASLYPATIEEIPEFLEGQGCESLYVPFPATVSVQAACLAMEMAAAWANGTASPRLRTRVVAQGFSVATADGDPATLGGCPACGT